jgi:Trk K+ transport system NAD-binding subunit
VIAIQRGEQLIFPEPGTEIRPGDFLSVLVPDNAEERLREALGAGLDRAKPTQDVPMI